MLAAAAQMFLGKTQREIKQVALETLEGHQRAIMGLMTVEEIYQVKSKGINASKYLMLGPAQVQRESVRGGLIGSPQYGHYRCIVHAQGRARRRGVSVSSALS